MRGIHALGAQSRSLAGVLRRVTAGLQQLRQTLELAVMRRPFWIAQATARRTDTGVPQVLRLERVRGPSAWPRRPALTRGLRGA